VEGWGDTLDWQQSRGAAGRLRQGTVGCFLIVKGGGVLGRRFQLMCGIGRREQGLGKMK